MGAINDLPPPSPKSGERVGQPAIENIDRRIESLEKDQLSKWDIATTTLTLLGGIASIVGVIFGILKYVKGG